MNLLLISPPILVESQLDFLTPLQTICLTILHLMSIVQVSQSVFSFYFKLNYRVTTERLTLGQFTEFSPFSPDSHALTCACVYTSVHFCADLCDHHNQDTIAPSPQALPLEPSIPQAHL